MRPFGMFFDRLVCTILTPRSLYPAVPVDIKMAVADDVLPTGHKIPAGTAVAWAAWPMGRHSSLWDKPLEWIPERWYVGHNVCKRIPDVIIYLGSEIHC